MSMRTDQRWIDSSMNDEARRSRSGRVAWYGMAFRMESLMLLVFLMVSVMILTGVFATAYIKGSDADELLHATMLATGGSVNGAEAFAADPLADVPETVYYVVEDGSVVPAADDDESAYAVTRVVTDEAQSGGTLYRATISINHDGEEVYSLQTARYVSDGRS